MKKIDFSNVQEAAEGNRPGEGGYTCRIIKAEDVPDKEYLRIEYDFADGQFKGYYQYRQDQYGYWGGHYIRSYKEKALPFFKRMLSVVEKSNKGFVWKDNEHDLEGKLVGLVLGEEEYEANDGTIKTRTYVDREISLEDLKNKKFKIPEKKCIARETAITGTEEFMQIPDNAADGIPF